MKYAPHSVKAHLAIAHELVRLTLCGRGPARPELLRPIRDDKTRIQRKKRRDRRTLKR